MTAAPRRISVSIRYRPAAQFRTTVIGEAVAFLVMEYLEGQTLAARLEKVRYRIKRPVEDASATPIIVVLLDWTAVLKK